VLVCEPLRAASGGALLTYTDITERKLAEKALARRALHDDLTGLPNRLQFVTRITSALNSRRRGGGLTALLFLDLDRFKIVNDDLGHATGDALLLGVAERLRATLRPGDTIGRFGGDEFVVLCEGLKRPEDALDLARRVIDALSAPIDLQGRQIHVTASIGVAVADSHERDSERLLANADIAMYAAKAVGRQAVMQFDESMHRTQIDRLEVEDDLRRAIAGGQLRLCYQPYVDIVTGEAVGAEALVRWHHPTRGILTPDEFISIAEQTGLIVPLGRWVLEEACRTLAEWGETGPLAPAARLAVNVSVHELTTPGFVDTVSSILAASGAEPGRLCFEITETAMMRDPATTAVVLAELHSCGVTIAVDDFGTGYASLAYLNIFPVQTVKIDRVFVEGLHRDRAGAAIIAGVVAIANGLDLTVIAEGVETREQCRQLRELGVHYAQGYLFGRPQEAAGLGPVEVQGES
jgi:diguanylate cyclase (GGDEF)-like protein